MPRPSLVIITSLFLLLCCPNLTGQPMPGGVEKPIYWYQTIDNRLVEVYHQGPSINGQSWTLKNGQRVLLRPEAHAPIPLPESVKDELTIFTVYFPSPSNETTVWSISSDDTTRQLLTTQRLANLQRGEYLDFTGTEVTGASQLHEQNEIINRIQSPIGLLSSPVLRTVTRMGSDEEKELNTPIIPTRRISANTNYLHIAHHLSTLPLPSTPSQAIAEIIVYDHMLSPKARQQIESYLALKYGISINQTLPRHYLDNNGHPIWDANLHGSYNHRITGLGTAPISAWAQTTAASYTNNGGLINISLPTDRTTDQQYNYFTFSDNNLPTDLADQSTDRPANHKTLLQRKWSAQATGFDHLRLNISIDTRQLFATLPAQHSWLLAIDSSGTGNFSPETTSYHPISQLLSNSVAHWNNISWPGQQHIHFTLATDWQPPAYAPANNDLFQKVILSPNPSTDGHFQLRVSLSNEYNLMVTAYDASGRAIWQQEGPRNTHHQFDGYLPQAGVYHFQVQAASQSTTVSLIVQ